MKYFIVLIALLCSSLYINAQGVSFSTAKPYKIGEKLKYKIRYSLYSNIDVAELMLSVDKEVINDKTYHKLIAHGIVYNYYESLVNGEFGYQSVINPSNLMPRLYLRYMKRNGNETKRIVMMAQDKKLAIEKDTKKKSTIKSNTMDMLSILYYVRSVDFSKLKPGSSFTVNVMVGSGTYNIGIIYSGIEQVKTYKGTVSCLKLHPKLDKSLIEGLNKFSISKDDKLIKSSEQISFWLTNDNNKVPVKVSTVTNLGNVEINLYQTENLNQADGLLK